MHIPNYEKQRKHIHKNQALILHAILQIDVPLDPFKMLLTIYAFITCMGEQHKLAADANYRKEDNKGEATEFLV